MICPEIHYKKSDTGVTIVSCYGTDGHIFLPDEIAGLPVTGIAPYAFSSGDEEEGTFVWESEEAALASERVRLKEELVLEMHLPRYVREIGLYAFYRCRNMRKMTLHDELLDIGGGALTGCRFQEVEIYFHGGECSALKSIVDEIRFAVHGLLYYEQQDGTTEMAEVLFPEHYEEAVENTPARILYTSHHGAGGYYRQCFYNRELDYQKYDELLPWAVAEEEPAVVAALALNRLVHPYRLSASARSDYETYVREHMQEAAKLLIAQEDTEKLHFLSAHAYWSESALDEAIEYAGAGKKTEILSVLMDEKHARFPKKKKMFEL